MCEEVGENQDDVYFMAYSYLLLCTPFCLVGLAGEGNKIPTSTRTNDEIVKMRSKGVFKRICLLQSNCVYVRREGCVEKIHRGWVAPLCLEKITSHPGAYHCG